MRKKAEILRRLRDLEHDISSLELTRETYNFNLGKIRALNWVLNKD